MPPFDNVKNILESFIPFNPGRRINSYLGLKCSNLESFLYYRVSALEHYFIWTKKSHSSIVVLVWDKHSYILKRTGKKKNGFL